ncbi:MAG: enoyl-CoA hydratase-related protein [Dehalococcoidia bacterium]
MALSLTRDGDVVVVEGAADAAAGELRAALDALTGGYETRCVVLALAGDGAGESDAAWLARWFPVPVMAAVEGGITGTAVALAMAADIRVAAREASVVLPGEFPGELAERANAIVGEARGMLTASEAFARGVVSALTEPGGALAEALHIARVIAGRGPIATRLGKEAVWRGLPQPLEQALRFETDLTLLLQTTKDRAEGVRAFLEKRAPVFTGE